MMKVLTTGGIIALPGRLTYPSVTSVLYRTGEEVVIVDPGSPLDTERLILALRKEGLKPEQVTLAVLTHLHFDHFYNLMYLPNARVVYHARARRSMTIKTPVLTRQGDLRLFDLLTRHAPGVVELQEEEGEIVPGIRYRTYDIHFPGHLLIFLQGEAHTWACLGDMFPFPGHLNLIKEGTLGLGRKTREMLRRAIEEADLLIPGHGPPMNPADIAFVLKLEEERG